MDIDYYLKMGLENKASDIHITVGAPVIARVHGQLQALSDRALVPEDSLDIAKHILSEKEMQTVMEKGEVDTSYSIPNVGRYRVNIFKQRGVFGGVLRIVTEKVPSMEELKLPKSFQELCKKKRGIILVTGPTGSGKSTTMASMIDYMNHTMNHHVITIEDPIEYLHKHGTCIINQRQIGKDSMSFDNALRGALRQDPDVILVGEMRDLETISVALTAAETGHLVMSTLHTIGAAKTVDRIVDIFPSDQQQQIKTQLGTVIEAVISQQIIPRMDGKGRVVAFEIMIANNAIRNLIREGKTHQMNSTIQTCASEGMQTMDGALIDLYRQRLIDKKNLYQYAVDTDYVQSQIG